MGEHVVARVDELGDGESLTTVVEGRPVGVFNVGGEFLALHNRCVHQSGPLCEGVVMAILKARIDPRGRIKEYYDPTQPVLACPWHGWEYDLRTGRLIGDPTRGVRVYETRVEDGEVKVVV